MNVVIKIMAAIAILVMAGCADVGIRTHANPCEGIGGEIKVQLFGKGQKVSQCIVNGQPVGVPGYPVYQTQPGEPTARTLGSLEVVAAPIAAEGTEQTSMDCSIPEANGRVSYFCNTQLHVRRFKVMGKPVIMQGGNDGRY